MLCYCSNEKTSNVKGFFDGINDIILQIVDMIMNFAHMGYLIFDGIVVI